MPFREEDINPKSIEQAKPKRISKSNCYERDYVETSIFPILLPCLEQMLETAKVNKCFEVEIFSLIKAI